MTLLALMLFGVGMLCTVGWAQDTPPAADTAVEKKAEAAPVATDAKVENEAKTDEQKEEAAAEAPPMPMSEMQYSFDNFILFICAVLVIFMQAGFSLVETGLNAAKNAVNIMLKNFMDFCIGALVFFFVGYGLMYPKNFPTTLTSDELNKKAVDSWVMFGGSGIPVDDQASVGGGVLYKQVDFLFQVAFAATAATIVSGAVAGRIKFPAYIIFTGVMTALIYPISGMWKWGGGWLNDLGFVDFAGSAVVHMVGGFCGLAGAIALGPRIGRYVNGKVVPMPGHNLPMVALGVFVLMIGWYGFNPGSQLVFTGKGNVATTMLVAVNTTLAGCAGGCAGLLFSWVLFKKPDLTLALNGTLAGLVAITANCHCVSNNESMIIGAVAGVIVILGIMLLDKVKIDDPVGAFPVHGLCGAWAILATGIFGYAAKPDDAIAKLATELKVDPSKLTEAQTNAIDLMVQIKGLAVYAAWPFVTGLVLFMILKAIGMLRVSAEEEVKGLDICEHGMYAYPSSQVNESYS